jgi:hypothetical protein
LVDDEVVDDIAEPQVVSGGRFGKALLRRLDQTMRNGDIDAEAPGQDPLVQGLPAQVRRPRSDEVKLLECIAAQRQGESFLASFACIDLGSVGHRRVSPRGVEKPTLVKATAGRSARGTGERPAELDGFKGWSAVGAIRLLQESERY